MRVLVAAHDFHPDLESGGSGRYVHETARRLVDRGHDVAVVVRRRGRVPSYETIAGIDVYRYDLDVANRSAPAILRQLPRALRTVERYYDHVTADGSLDALSYQGPVSSLLVDAVAHSAVPRTATFHSPWPTEYELRTRFDSLWPARRQFNVRLRRFLEAHVLAECDEILTLSAFMRDELQRTYGDEFDARVVPGGVDLDRFAPSATPLADLDSNGLSFLTVRRLTPRMGHDQLLEAFATVVDHHPDATLFVAGDGHFRHHLERRTTELGLDENVRFLGYVPDSDLPGAYAAADVFVLPTQELEGFGLATLEALASGTPVVATPVGGSVELLAGLDDLPAPTLAAGRDADALSNAMLAWADLSPDERETASERCRQHARPYSWERTVDELEKLYADTSVLTDSLPTAGGHRRLRH